jgi:hypothetical protein
MRNESRDVQNSNNTNIEEAQNLTISNVWEESTNDEDKEEAADLYGEVSRLADLGISGKQISERVSLPKSEIDLIINLKRKGYRSAA